MKTKTLLLIATTLVLTSCQRSCQRFNKNWQTSERTYTITMYSGGKPVFVDRFTGILNDSEHSDGCYYTKGDTLIEVSGDYVVKSEN